MKILSIGLLIALTPLLLPTIMRAQSTCTTPYIVQPRDGLIKIARACDVAYRDLLAANPQITNPSRIEVGDEIIIPGADQAPATPTPVPENVNQLVENARVLPVSSAPI
ncbi:MAG: LysM domain-containing protein [Caldilineaceae bacterium]